MDVGQVRFLRIGVDPEAGVGDDREHRLAGRRDTPDLDLGHLRRYAVDRRDDLGVAQIAFGVLEARLRLHVVGKVLDRRVGAAAELHRHRRLLLAHEFEDLLGLDEVAHRGVAIRRGSRAMDGEAVLAVEVGLAHSHGVLAHFDLVGVADVRGLQIGEFDPGRLDAALGERERDLIGLRIDVEQRIADLHLLPLRHMDGGDCAGDLGRDERLVGADIGVVGRDITPAAQPPAEAERERYERNHHEHDEPADAALRLDGDRRLGGRRLRRGLRRLRARRGGSRRGELDRLRRLGGGRRRLRLRLARALLPDRLRRRKRQRLGRLRRRVFLWGIAPRRWLRLGHFDSAPEINSFLRLDLMILRPSCMASIVLSSTPAKAPSHQVLGEGAEADERRSCFLGEIEAVWRAGPSRRRAARQGRRRSVCRSGGRA